MYVLGIDVSTTATKAVLVGEDGRVRGIGTDHLWEQSRQHRPEVDGLTGASYAEFVFHTDPWRPQPARCAYRARYAT